MIKKIKLDDAYSLKTPKDSIQLYKKWAQTYDKDFAFTSAWEYVGEPSDAILHKEELEFNEIELKQRSYK